ncbi:MAG: HlyD family efflux transporter periplasmic adaptor subunit [Phormidesmis sp. RL_2_1]|nr:HlyD family efflux transporter periplasmic adaptor subunit [Phormidesmis sp. RL_2_1]
MTHLVPAHPDSEQTTPTSGAASRMFDLKQKLPIFLPLGLLMIAAGLGVRYWLSRPDHSAMELSGRIESYESDLAATVGGRIESIAVREGDRVSANQVVARLDDQSLNARLDAAQARVNAAQQKVTQAALQIDVANTQVQEARFTLEQSQGESAGRISQSEANVATAQAQLSAAQAQVQQAESALTLARADRDRFSTLVSQGAISQQQFDQSQTRFKTAQDTLLAQQAAVDAAQQQVAAAQGALTQSRTTQFNPDIRTTQVNRNQTQQAQAQTQLAVAEAELAQARAAQREIEAQINDLAIKSPIDGVVLSRSAEPGEVVAAGTTLLTVVNLADVYLRGYVPEGEIGALSVGQAARVFLDSAPDRPLAARVTAIDTEASFTPENIYFQADRVTQVFGLKLAIDNPQGFAKPGMPAEGEILLETAESVP